MSKYVSMELNDGGYWESVACDNTVCERPRKEQVGEILDCTEVIPAIKTQVGGSHYVDLNPQPFDAIQSWGLSYALGTAVNYLVRAGRKGPALEDLKKAVHILQMEIERCQK